MGKNRKMIVGDWVEVRSKEEILRTLDERGQLDGMPFMPEMFQFCGRKFQVFKRAHKTCDPDLESRRIDNAVHLETRCNGQAHGGCEAGCLVFWKEAWLRRVDSGIVADHVSYTADQPNGNQIISIGGCIEDRVWQNVKIAGVGSDPPTYVCQTTEVQYAGRPLKWWDVRQYFEDYTSGNVGLPRLLSGLLYSVYYNVSQAGIGLGPVMRRLYDLARPLWGGSQWPRKMGAIPEGRPTPTATLNLQAGELVRIKPHDDILQTVNTDNRNRGLWWDAELVPYIGGTFRVLRRVTKIIDEKTGKMQEMKTPCVILDSVVCQARYSACRMFCPRNTYAYWREIWLQRVEPGADTGNVPSEVGESIISSRQ